MIVSDIAIGAATLKWDENWLKAESKSSVDDIILILSHKTTYDESQIKVELSSRVEWRALQFCRRLFHVE